MLSTKMGFDLYFRSIKKEYDDTIKDPEKLARYVKFYQKQRKVDYSNSK